VTVSIEDEAEIENSTTRSRTNSEDDDVTGFLGYQSSLNRVLPQALTSGTDLLNLSSSSTLLRPAAEALEDAIPLAQGQRQVAPRRSRTNPPQNGLQK
jgi:hypothetical protein